MIALVLLTAGLGAVTTSETMSHGSTHLVGKNLPIDPGATDPLNIAAHNSPALVANPRNAANLVIADRVDTPRFSCSLHVSLDGGVNWRPTPIPVPAGKLRACVTPDASFGTDGTLYLAFVSFAGVPALGTVPDALWVATSFDGGRTLSQPVKVAGPSVFHARVVADKTAARRVYVTWVRASETSTYGLPNTGNPIVMSRSDDAGATWREPAVVSSPSRQRVVTPVPAMSAKGELFVAYLDVGDDRLDYGGAHEDRGGDPYQGTWSLVVARSRDSGTTWSEATVDNGIVPISRFRMVFPAAPSLAVHSRSGRVYVAFHDGREGDADVWLWRSDDGQHWSQPTRVNDTPPRDRRAQYLPAVAVAPNGRVDIVYYDRRADDADVMNEVSLQRSVDGGRTFSRRLRLSDRSFDSRIGFGSDKGMSELGHRLGLLSTDTGAFAVWADTRAGDRISGKQNLARELVALSPGSPLRSALQLAGVAMGTLGLAALVLALARQIAPVPRPSRNSG